MTAVLSRHLSAAPRSLSGGDLHVERTDIGFANIGTDRVGIEIVVINHGEGRSKPAPAVIQAAPLGAFVPWQPVAVALVPALEPGESYRLRLGAHVAPQPALGRFDRVPPRRLLTALAADDDAETPRRGRPANGTLPADLFRLLGNANPHWAGNLNIFVNGREVERHLAQALRIYPGRLNLAMFVVGSRHDAYSFSLHGDGAHWESALYNGTSSASFSGPDQACCLRLGEWVKVTGMGVVILAVKPPCDCERGVVEVRVRQRSTGKQAVVEFSLDPKAAGPGCFVV
jgi:hypothetical protein